MPCMCWYDPGEPNKKHFKMLCQGVVDLINEMEKEGDPLGISVKDAQELIAHLYNPHVCDENRTREGLK
jgi:hypothetical protein